ncbi:MAG: 1-(5-phosphoribosyl)-5-[(5-phosphoribosylamino)methylideneamino]imidazole-4-carboxamide isomerase [Ignavibacteria bacterium GWB2_36_8]|nr:MAG: 1-(5-phosphoribosyl)-5-[(5-phosphoribosylamino)methylideneamino]imidazole-4-carboxamide isomerase [Ignavibacteria bacterium GWB2_36_8]
MIIIPAIDIYDDKVVRLSKGDFREVSFYNESPLKQAKIFEEVGFDLIHIVDLEGAKTRKFTAIDIIKEIKSETSLKIQFGGGIRDGKTAFQIFQAGIDYAVIGSLPVKNRDEFKLIVKQHSPDKIVTAVDVRDEKLYISGWTEEVDLSPYDLIDFCMEIGIRRFICTDIAKDGTMKGLSVELYEKIMRRYPEIKLIASGGVKDIEEIKKLKELNPYAVVVGKAIYEEKIDLKELSELAL